ncbi:MAG: glycoside hydrolase family 18 protein [Draconibacterium sp.]
MKDRKVHTKKHGQGPGILLLLLALLFFCTIADAQTEISPSTLKLQDTTSFQDSTKGLLQKIVKPFKFKDNRNRKEKERVYEYMLELIEKGDLKIDTATVSEIMMQLDSLDRQGELNASDIKAIFEEAASNQKTSKEARDSLKTVISAVIQAKDEENTADEQAFDDEIEKRLLPVKTWQNSTENHLFSDTLVSGDTTFYTDHQLKLHKKIKTIGWHNAWMKQEFQRYSYNYLSVLNLYGYELSASGKCAKPNYIKNFEAPQGVIDYARNANCAVHLTVYSKMPSEISRFLKNNKAWDTLTEELDSLIKRNPLTGINIYFEDVAINESQNFTAFINHLSTHLKAKSDSFVVSLSIPAITNQASIDKISAYNFKELSSFVDYYYVLTDRMIDGRVDISRALSPLYPSKKYGDRSIESTINSYQNFGIPAPRLILTLSYLGIGWNVADFEGQLRNTATTNLTYQSVVENYLNTDELGKSILPGFDRRQVAAYLNVIGKTPDRNMQIWYDNDQSLYEKYLWALDQNLGGVAVRGLGYDDGRPELWDAMGAALLEIDTLITDQKMIIRDTLPDIDWRQYLKIFIEDFKWAVAVDLEYYTNLIDSTTCDCRFNADSVAGYRDSSIIWHEWQPYSSSVSIDKRNRLNNSIICNCIFVRWDIYGNIFRWCWVIALATIALFYFFSLYIERFKIGGKSIRNAIKIVQFFSFVVFILTISCWFYLSPGIDMIGASSEGSNIGILFIALIFGSILGWLIHSWYKSGKSVPKNRP